MFKKVLVAVELTTESAAFVLERARPFLSADGELYAVHVVEPQYVQYSFDPTFTGSLTRALEKDALDVAAQRLAELCKPFGVDADHQIVLLGRVAERLHQLASEQPFDLIVIGSHGQEGWRTLLGSTANAVLHGAPVHVATIRMPRSLT